MGRLRNELINGATVTAAGTVQADAGAIRTKSPAIISAAGDDTVGIKLPAVTKGKLYFVKNTGSGGLKVWPSGTNQINAITAGSSITMATVTSAAFVGLDTIHWYTVPLLPS